MITQSTRFETQPAQLLCRSKASIILCGLPVIERLFSLINPTLSVHSAFRDGDKVASGKKILEVTGTYRSLALGARTCKSILQQLSGISTLTYEYEKRIYRSSCVISEHRRKLLPILKLQDYAVKIGGGKNHRAPTYDEARVEFSKNSTSATFKKKVKTARRQNPSSILIVEIISPDQVDLAIDHGADRLAVFVSNHQKVKNCIRQTRGRIPIEICGPIQIGDLKPLIHLGIDSISAESIIASAKPAQIDVKIAPAG